MFSFYFFFRLLLYAASLYIMLLFCYRCCYDCYCCWWWLWRWGFFALVVIWINNICERRAWSIFPHFSCFPAPFSILHILKTTRKNKKISIFGNCFLNRDESQQIQIFRSCLHRNSKEHNYSRVSIVVTYAVLC